MPSGGGPVRGQRGQRDPLALAGPQTGRRAAGASGRIEGHADLILGLVERKSDITLAELQTALAEQGVGTSLSSLWRFFVRRRITLKKSRRTRTNRAAPTS